MFTRWLAALALALALVLPAGAVAPGNGGGGGEFQASGVIAAVSAPGEARVVTVEVRSGPSALVGREIALPAPEGTLIKRNHNPSDRIAFSALREGMNVDISASASGAEGPFRLSWLSVQTRVETPRTEQPQAQPGFSLAFSSRLWRVQAEVLTVDPAGRVEVDVQAVPGAGRYTSQLREIRARGAVVVVGPLVAVTTSAGTPITVTDLKPDDQVQIVGRFLRQSKWITDETDGERTPTMVAKRIRVLNR